MCAYEAFNESIQVYCLFWVSLGKSLSKNFGGKKKQVHKFFIFFKYVLRVFLSLFKMT